jgi:exodeoxyribonuclease V gamma subunit
MPQRCDPLKPWSLAGELSSVFEKYQAWRRDWLLRWGRCRRRPAGRACVPSRRARRTARAHRRLPGPDRADAPLPVGLPKRLFAFATLNVSPDVLRVLATGARGHAALLPAHAGGRWWGDLQTARTPARGAAGPELFADSVPDNPCCKPGAAGRDFMAVLGGYEVVHPQREIEAWVDPLQGQRTPLAAAASATACCARCSRTCCSAQPHRPQPASACLPHPPARAAGVARPAARVAGRPALRPAAAAAQIAAGAGHRPVRAVPEAVFGGSGHGDALPWALADASPLAGEPLAEVFLRLLDLPIARFGLDETSTRWPAPIAEAAGLDADAVERLHGWLRGRRALGAGCRASRRAGRAAGRGLTWQFALDRLLLGHASGSDADVAGVAAWPELEGSALAALDTLIRCCASWRGRPSNSASPAPPRSGASAC